ncbi:MAG: hypothetical protein KAS72_11535 [Phycisphaerales bacterium]|nr:hypothetical protein [Phycisphaerales bacterium]
MKGLQRMAAVAVSACACAFAGADAPLVYSNGYVCGGSGNRMYEYPVDSASYPMMEFRVGTNDLNIGNYTDVVTPQGWHFAVEDVPMMHACGIFTRPGGFSSPCWSVTLGSVHWWTDDPEHAVEQFTFGYDHIWPPEDIGWELTTQRPGPPPEQFIFIEHWDSAVGWGMGPVHGPYPPAVYCWSNGDCHEDHYCFFYVCAAETGVCMPRPEECQEIYDPVCGCDGQTYDNACEAARAGISVDYKGPCGGIPGDLNGDGCVDQTDLGILLASYEIDAGGDCDGDGDTDQADLGILLANYGVGC